jgi:hypothetical protein
VAYWRRIDLVTRSATRVDGELEDNFHHFRVSLEHDGERVTAIDGDAVRHPWSTCPEALDPLRDLLGAPVTREAAVIAAHADARRTCTHWFDLSGLAVAQAAAGRDRRRYDVTIPDRDAEGRTTAALARDGAEVLHWDIDFQSVLGPDPFTGQGTGRGFLAWAAATFVGDPDAEEAAAVLRRACRISMARLMDLDQFERAAEVGQGMEGTCHSFAPAVVDRALRVRGSSRD